MRISYYRIGLRPLELLLASPWFSCAMSARRRHELRFRHCTHLHDAASGCMAAVHTLHRIADLTRFARLTRAAVVDVVEAHDAVVLIAQPVRRTAHLVTGAGVGAAWATAHAETSQTDLPTRAVGVIAALLADDTAVHLTRRAGASPILTSPTAQALGIIAALPADTTTVDVSRRANTGSVLAGLPTHAVCIVAALLAGPSAADLTA